MMDGKMGGKLPGGADHDRSENPLHLNFEGTQKAVKRKAGAAPAFAKTEVLPGTIAELLFQLNLFMAASTP